MIEGCLKAAAELHQVPAGVLVLLMSVEAGRLGEVSQNTNGTVDIGPMQVNDTWVPKIAGHWGASHDAAYRALRDNFCANVEGGAWILRQALDEAHGDLWKGVAQGNRIWNSAATLAGFCVSGEIDSTGSRMIRGAGECFGSLYRMLERFGRPSHWQCGAA